MNEIRKIEFSGNFDPSGMTEDALKEWSSDPKRSLSDLGRAEIALTNKLMGLSSGSAMRLVELKQGIIKAAIEQLNAESMQKLEEDYHIGKNNIFDDPKY